MERAGPGLEKIVAAGLRRAPAGEGPLLAWPVVCGHVVAQRTRAVDFTEGILCVEVPDKGWRTELRELAPQYLAAINKFVSDKVLRIEFVLPAKKVANLK